MIQILLIIGGLIPILTVLGCENTLPDGTQCPALGLTRYPDEYHCSKYYQCDEGCLTHPTCPADHLFDINDNICKEPYTVNLIFFFNAINFLNKKKKKKNR